MNRLRGAYCYLSGAIDCASDLGVGWREEFIEKAEQAQLGLRVMNPCAKPASCTQEIEDDIRVVEKFRENGDWEEMRQFVKGFRREDLRFTDLADFLVIKVDRETHMCGSYDELFVAERQSKPLFCIVEGGIEKLPTWLFGVFRLENIFSTVDECLNRLIELNSQEEELGKRWVLIRQFLENDECRDAIK